MCCIGLSNHQHCGPYTVYVLHNADNLHAGFSNFIGRSAALTTGYSIRGHHDYRKQTPKQTWTKSRKI